jgi:hypothetical protein
MKLLRVTNCHSTVRLHRRSQPTGLERSRQEPRPKPRVVVCLPPFRYPQASFTLLLDYQSLGRSLPTVKILVLGIRSPDREKRGNPLLRYLR